MRELGAFQQLIEGHAESDDKLLDELIEQWVVETEATLPRISRSPRNRRVDRVKLARLSDDSFRLRKSMRPV